jgi:hypothetical protein
METPNLIYIEQLARGEESVRKTLIDVIKSEFPDEKKEYFESLKSEDFKKIEDDVHRIKHKFSILGLESSYNNAVAFELNLRENILLKKQKEEFKNTLEVISKFLKTI